MQRYLVFLLLLVCCASVGSWAHEGRHQDGAQHSPRELSPMDLAKARAKWDTLSPERRAELAAAWSKLQQLAPEERAKLVERAERLRAMRQRFQEQLTPEARQRLEAMSPEQREQALRELVHAAGRERGARLRERLPEHTRAEFETLSPEERAQRMARFHEGLADRGLHLIMEKVGERVGVDRAELERLRALPSAEKEQAVRSLLARLSFDDARKLGLKADTAADLAALQTQPLPELVGAFMAARLERDLRAKGLSDERVQVLLRLAKALEPRQEDWTALQGLPEDQRRAAIEETRRARTVQALRASGLLDEATLQRLESLRGAESAAEVRKVLEDLGLPTRRGGWRGRGERGERGGHESGDRPNDRPNDRGHRDR